MLIEVDWTVDFSDDVEVVGNWCTSIYRDGVDDDIKVEGMG